MQAMTGLLLLLPHAAVLLLPHAAVLLLPHAAVLLLPHAAVLLLPHAAVLLLPHAAVLLLLHAAVLLLQCYTPTTLPTPLSIHCCYLYFLCQPSFHCWDIVSTGYFELI